MSPTYQSYSVTAGANHRKVWMVSLCPCSSGTQRDSISASAGMTLMELLVAMLIFVSIMSGVAALFANASRSVSQANIAIDGYDRARSAMTRLELDLTSAFASRDVGEKYKFYGQGNGFCYIGWTEGGKLARITVNLRRTDKHFATELMAPARTYLERALSFDLSKNPLTTQLPQSTLAMIAYLVRKEIIEPGAMEAAWISWANESFVSRTLESISSIGTADERTLRANSADNPVNLPVYMVTGALTRLQENDVQDLVSFKDMTAALGWPEIAPIWPGVEEGYMNSVDFGLYCDVHNTLMWGGKYNPALQAPDGEKDLRHLIALNEPLVLGSSTVDKILRASLCEQWLNKIALLKGNPTLNPNLDPLVYENNVSQYDLVDGIVTAVLISDLQGGTEADGLSDFDVFAVEPIFNYTNGEYKNNALIQKRYFNTRFNIPGYEKFFSGDGTNAAEAIKLFDCALSCGSARPAETACDSSTASDCEALSFGSPLDPRLPYAVEVNFWIAIDSGRISGSEFFRQFRRVIDIPSGFTRQD